MPHSHALYPKLSHVTVRFGNGAQFFHLLEGATLADIADRISDLGEQHVGVPLTIDVEFHSPTVGTTGPVHGQNPLTH